VLALIAGQGALPGLVREARPDALVCELDGYPAGLGPARAFRVERLGSFMADLRAAGVTEICLAGRVGRPKLDAALVDAATLPLVPRMMAALHLGDDAALRTVIGFFEEAGFTVRAAHEIVPHVLPPAGVLTRAGPGAAAERDVARAVAAHRAMGAADVGQALVVAQGHGHRGRGAARHRLDARLAPRAGVRAAALGGLFDDPFGVAADMFGGPAQVQRPRRDPALPPGGLLYKAPKPGQELRADLPAIGPGPLRARRRPDSRGS
jgi:UDP-2,3-diacylglucosamine hydrolase